MPRRAAIRSADLPRGLVLALFVIAAPLLAVIALQVYEALNRPPQLARNRALIAHTFEVLETTERLRATAQNAERAQRGYLLTGAPAFLEGYRVQATETRSLLEQLRRLTSDNREQLRRMPVLTDALDEWLNERDQTVEAYEKDGVAAAQQLVRSRASINTLRDVNLVLDAAIATERDLLNERQTRALEGDTRVRNVAIATGTIDALLLALGATLTVRVFRRTRQQEMVHRETEQRLNDQLLQSQSALAQTQKMEALGQLTGGVAHDFNNLLHVIKNAAHIVQRRLHGADGEVTRYLEMIKRNTDRAASTTARLLAFARQQPLDPKPTDINKVVSGMAELLRDALGETVSMEVVLGSGLWTVALDRNHLETAILNLAINGRDAIPHSGKLTIETSNVFLDESYARIHAEVNPGQYAMVAVSDTGVGMPSEVASRAFEPFFTTKEFGRGTGLGLSQVFGFVKQSGGHVKIYTEQGQGTTIKMYFPRLLGAEAEKAAEMLPSQTIGSGESILVVEDDEDIRAFTAQILGELGYRVAVASEGHLALKVLEKLSGVDLLFTDVGLPGGITGRQLADEARRRWPSVKVLYTTGYARNSIIHHGRLDVGVELITKPFTQSTLAAKVRAVLDDSSSTVV
jgi:signal transduction histidine kinase